MILHELPFPRGQTYADSQVTLADGLAEYLVGWLCKTVDSTGRPLILQIVRADNALTNVGGKTVSFTAGKEGRNVDALCNADGEVSAIVDGGTGGYATTYDISQYDLFYTVYDGYVDAAGETDVNAAGIDVMGYASSDSVTTATAGKFIIGRSTEAVDTGIVEIHVQPGLKNSDPAS